MRWMTLDGREVMVGIISEVDREKAKKVEKVRRSRW